jgi:hypothetical protein
MNKPEIPAEWNGKPTEYKFFDGFTKASIPMKAVYILGFPLAAGLMEAFSYNSASHAASDAERTLTNKQLVTQTPPATHDTGTHFQDNVASLSRQHGPAR